METNNFIKDWQFWSAFIALAALILSQLPPIHKWFHAGKCTLELPGRIAITDMIGNSNIILHLTIKNTGSRDLKIKRMTTKIKKKDKEILNLPANNIQTITPPIHLSLFMPFTLKPGEEITRIVHFFNFFEKTDDKIYKASMSAFREQIRERNLEGKLDVDPQTVEPLKKLFEKLFTWTAGEYSAELLIETDSQNITSRFRFNIWESDENDLRRSTEIYTRGEFTHSPIETELHHH